MPKALRPILDVSLRVVGQAIRLVAAGAKRGVTTVVKVIRERRRGDPRTKADQPPSRPFVSEEAAASPSPAPGPPVGLADTPPAPGETLLGSAEPAAAPVHVSEEPTLVTESADAGAEGGAGPEFHVAEPWEGYADMRASDVAARLAEATAEEVAVVQLYETTHGGRKTVLTAAERRLKTLDASSGT